MIDPINVCELDAGSPRYQVPRFPDDSRNQQCENHRKAGGTPDLQDQLDRQQRNDAECNSAAGEQNTEEIERARPHDGDLRRHRVCVDDRRHGVGRVVKSVDELETEGDQQRYEEQQVWQKRRGLGAACGDIGIEAVRDEEQAAAKQQEKYYGGARVEAPVKRGTNRFRAGHRPCV
jgi:hypothetical protein